MKLTITIILPYDLYFFLGVPVVTPRILMEDGSDMLMEDGTIIELES